MEDDKRTCKFLKSITVACLDRSDSFNVSSAIQSDAIDKPDSFEDIHKRSFTVAEQKKGTSKSDVENGSKKITKIKLTKRVYLDTLFMTVCFH